jgi:hypothetical protein
VGQTLLLSIPCRTLDLVVVIVQANNVDPSKLDNFSGRASDTAAHVEHTHALFETHHVGQIMLMPGNSLQEGLAVGKATKVKTLSPAVLVQIRSQVVVTMRG